MWIGGDEEEACKSRRRDENNPQGARDEGEMMINLGAIIMKLEEQTQWIYNGMTETTESNKVDA